MCKAFKFNEVVIGVKQVFDCYGLILVQSPPYPEHGTIVTKMVYWDGWVQEEDLEKWTGGAWRRAEVMATHFKQKQRWYEVPRGEVIKAITLETEDQIILKVVTRKSRNLEAEICDRFVKTGRWNLVPEEVGTLIEF